MKKILLSFALGCLSLTMYAQTAVKDEHEGHAHAMKPAATSVNAKFAESLSLNKELHDFGKIPQGKPVTYEFEVKNTSASPVKISNVQASCGCTTPEWDKENAIAPGATTKITVGYNAVAEGAFTKPVTITYGDGVTKVINIKGEVWKTPAESAPANTGINAIKN